MCERARDRLDAFGQPAVHVELGQAVDGCLLGPDVVLRCLDLLLNESEQLLLAAAAHRRCHSALVRHFKNNSNCTHSIASHRKQHCAIFEERLDCILEKVEQPVKY